MRGSKALRIGAALALGLSGATQAHASQVVQQPPVGPPEVTVEAPERMVCRPITRTGTRLNLSADCRTRAQWAENSNVPRGPLAARSYRDVEHLSDRLQIITRRCDYCWKD